MNQKMRFCIVGRGSIGVRHLKNLLLLEPKSHVIFYSQAHNQKKNFYFYKKFGVKTLTTLKELKSFAPHAMIVANPTSHHKRVVRLGLKLKAHLFVEKPVFHNVSGVGSIKSQLIRNKIIFFSANNLRFHPALKCIKNMISKGQLGKIYFSKIHVGHYLPDFHPEEDYRLGYAARKDLGGGAVLTLQHEIDYAYWLFGKFKGIKSHVDKVSSLEIDVEDFACAVVQTEGGVLVEIHLDYLSMPPKRSIEIQGSKGSLYYVFGDRYLNFFNFRNKNYQKILDLKNFHFNQMYVDELKHFIKCIKQNEKTKIGFDESLYVLRQCLKIKKGVSL